MTSTIYTSINNRILNKIGNNNNNQITLQIPPNYKTGSTFNLYKYPNLESNSKIQVFIPDDSIIFDESNLDQLNVKLIVSNFSGIFEKKDTKDKPWAKKYYTIYLRYLDVILSCIIYQKTSDNNWYIFIEVPNKKEGWNPVFQDPQPKDPTQIYIAMNNSTDDVIPLGGWILTTKNNDPIDTKPIDFSIYVNSQSENMNDKLFIQNITPIDNSLQNAPQINNDDISGIYKKQSSKTDNWYTVLFQKQLNKVVDGNSKTIGAFDLFQQKQEPRRWYFFYNDYIKNKKVYLAYNESIDFEKIPTDKWISYYQYENPNENQITSYFMNIFYENIPPSIKIKSNNPNYVLFAPFKKDDKVFYQQLDIVNDVLLDKYIINLDGNKWVVSNNKDGNNPINEFENIKNSTNSQQYIGAVPVDGWKNDLMLDGDRTPMTSTKGFIQNN